MNLVCLSGTVARSPTVRDDGAGLAECRFTLTVDETSREGKSYPLFVPVQAWGRWAEQCGTLTVGDQVELTGKLSWRKQAGKCGQEHSQLVVSVREVQVLQGAEVQVST